jgi:hypothetical protein
MDAQERPSQDPGKTGWSGISVVEIDIKFPDDGTKKRGHLN